MDYAIFVTLEIRGRAISTETCSGWADAWRRVRDIRELGHVARVRKVGLTILRGGEIVTDTIVNIPFGA